MSVWQIGSISNGDNHIDAGITIYAYKNNMKYKMITDKRVNSSGRQLHTPNFQLVSESEVYRAISSSSRYQMPSGTIIGAHLSEYVGKIKITSNNRYSLPYWTAYTSNIPSLELIKVLPYDGVECSEGGLTQGSGKNLLTLFYYGAYEISTNAPYRYDNSSRKNRKLSNIAKVNSDMRAYATGVAKEMLLSCLPCSYIKQHVEGIFRGLTLDDWGNVCPNVRGAIMNDKLIETDCCLLYEMEPEIYKKAGEEYVQN